jgi:hypothetical protein
VRLPISGFLLELFSRVDGQCVLTDSPTAASACGTLSIVTDDELTERTVAIMRDLYDLKEDVLSGGGPQPAFDGGMLEAALSILRATIDDEDPRVLAETSRQLNARLARALAATTGA